VQHAPGRVLRGSWVQLAQILISGIAQGCIYGLIALGFVLICKATETVNFAQGELMMLGAFAGLAIYTGLGWPFPVACVVAVGVMALAGLAIERAVLRPILGQPAFAIVLVTIGLGYVARGAVTMVPNVGTETFALDVPYRFATVSAGTLVISVPQLIVIAVTAVLCVVLFALFRYTKIGIAMQAASQNQLAAYYMGIPVKRLNGVVWALSAAVAAMCRPTRPYPTSTTWLARYLRSVDSGSSPSGSANRSSARAKRERARIQRWAGSIAEKYSGLSAIEKIAPARIRLCPLAGRRSSVTPSPARMNENSPICASPAETVNAVFSG